MKTIVRQTLCQLRRWSIMTILCGCTIYAQAANPTDDPHLFCNFESPMASPASKFHAPGGGGEVSIVANPYKTGLNSSNNVLMVKSPSGANWGG